MNAVPPPAHFAVDLSDAVLAAIAAHADAADRGEDDLVPDIALLARCGVLAAPLPPAFGGTGLGLGPDGAAPCLELLRRLGRANLSVARLVEGHVNALKLLMLYAAPSVRERVAAAVRDGLLLGVWCADGTPAASLTRTQAGIALSGQKRFASGLGVVGAAVITVATADGPQLVLVPTDDPVRADRSAWHQSGMRATLSGNFALDGLVVGDDAAVGAPGDLLREPFFEGGVWRYCAAHLGGAEALYAETLASLARAARADDPHQLHRIAAAAIACETARLWIDRAAARVEGGTGDPNGAAAYALLAREATEAACLAVIATAERAVGTAAFDTAGKIDRMRQDLSLFLRQAAPDAKRTRAARALVAANSLPEAL